MAILLTSKGEEIRIDDADARQFEGLSVRLLPDGYPAVRVDGKWFLLSRLIMSAPKGLCVDHANHDVLDNRRENLRICTSQENNRNRRKVIRANFTSTFKGVSYSKGFWVAVINAGGPKSIQLGRYRTELEAARAYDIAALKHHREFALINGVDPSIAPHRLDTQVSRKFRLKPKWDDLSGLDL